MRTKLRRDQIEWSIEIERDDATVRGNAIASGHDDFDRRVENGILMRLTNGDIWAWASVAVTGTLGPLSATDYLGACSYKDESDFKACGYYEDMQNAVIDELESQLRDLRNMIGN